MSTDDRSRSRVGVALFVVVLVLLVTLIFVGVIIQSGNRHSTESGGETQPLAPTSTPSSTPDSDQTTSPVPSDVMDTFEDEDLPEVFNPVVSDEPQPTTEQILAYERAYFTSDPSQRETLIKPLATKQYLAEELNREPVKYERVEVHVVTSETNIESVTVGDTRFTAYVVTRVFLETVRDGEVVNRFSGPRHSSVWVNTADGWRVATNAGED